MAIFGIDMLDFWGVVKMGSSSPRDRGENNINNTYLKPRFFP